MEQHGALAREGVLVNGIAAIGNARGLLDARVELGKVTVVEGGAVLLEKRNHLFGDVTLVEAITRCDDARCASASLGRALGLDHAPQGPGSASGNVREAHGAPSTSTAFGAQPWPTIDVTLPVSCG